jgi:hypothetical protein
MVSSDFAQINGVPQAEITCLLMHLLHNYNGYIGFNKRYDEIYSGKKATLLKTSYSALILYRYISFIHPIGNIIFVYYYKRNHQMLCIVSFFEEAAEYVIV